MKFLFNIRKELELILLGLIVLALIVIIGNELKLLGYAKANKEVAYAIRVVEEESNILTTKDDYDNLLKECRKFIYNNYTSSSTVDTDVIVDEDLYIDSEEQTIDDKKSFFNHANAVYCKGMLLVSFLNSSGEMKSVAAAIDKKADAIRVVDINNISIFEKFNDYSTNEEIDNIGKLILSVLKSETHKLDNTLTYKYFTNNGYKDFIAEINESNSISNADITFMKLGKSKIDLDYNDRIILQILATEDSRSIYITTLVKIDRNGKIFDIDIL